MSSYRVFFCPTLHPLKKMFLAIVIDYGAAARKTFRLYAPRIILPNKLNWWVIYSNLCRIQHVNGRHKTFIHTCSTLLLFFIFTGGKKTVRLSLFFVVSIFSFKADRLDCDLCSVCTLRQFCLPEEKAFSLQESDKRYVQKAKIGGQSALGVWHSPTRFGKTCRAQVRNAEPESFPKHFRYFLTGGNEVNRAFLRGSHDNK